MCSTVYYIYNINFKIKNLLFLAEYKTQYDKDEVCDNELLNGNMDPEYIPDEPIIFNPVSSPSFEVSPLKFTVTKTNIDNLAPSSIVKIQQKYRREKNKLKRSLAESLAPGQGETLAELLSDSDSGNDNSKDLDAIIKMYKASNKLSR